MLKFRNRQQAEAEPEHPRLFAEPSAIADTSLEGGERRMKAGDGSPIELVRPQAYATERARIRLNPFDHRRVVRNPRRGARKTFAEMFSAGADDRVRLGQDAQPQHFVDGRIGDYRVDFPSTICSRKVLWRTIAQPMRRPGAPWHFESEPVTITRELRVAALCAISSSL